MPEKKPVPPPAPRNRHERRERAAKQRKARPWTRPKPKPELPGEWFTYSPSPGCKPVFEVIRDGMGEMDKPAHTITGSPGDVVVVPGEDDKPELRPYQKRAMDAALNSGSFIVDSDGCAVGIGGFTRPTAPADPPPATFDAFVGSTRVETYPTCPELTALEEEEERGNMLLGMSLTEPQ